MDPDRKDSAITAPQALLLVAPGCPHCAGMLDHLGTLVKEGTLGRLEIVNVAVDTKTAQVLSVRSVPWTRIGSFDLVGLHTLEELRHWAEMAGRDEGMTVYLGELLATARRHEVTLRVRAEPALLHRLVDLLGDPETALSTRIGVMATLEEFQGEAVLESLVGPLSEFTTHASERVRADVCHALALTGSVAALDALRRCMADPDDEVRETAAEGINLLTGALPPPH
jgi:hypothetical protein